VTPAAVTAAGYSGCTWNILDYQQLQPSEDKINFLTRGTMELSPTLTAFAEVGIFNSKVSTTYTPSSVSGSWADPVGGAVKNNVAITMGAGHPDNPFNAASGANGGAGYNARLRYVTADLGGRNNTYDTTVSRILGGLKGTAYNWDWETGLLYTESKTDQTTDGYIRDSVLRDYLNATNLSGMNPTKTYYRLGTNAGLNSAATNAAIAPHITNTSKTSITSLDMKATRELMQLAGGAMSLAVGAEFRKEEVDSPPKPFTYAADIIGLGYSGFSGSRNIAAVYGELNAPVLKNLELSAALRGDHYSDYGSSTTPKIGFKYTPIQQLVVRGTYAEGFRAPGAAESGKSVGGSAGYTNVIDPIRCPGGVVAPGAVSGDCNTQVLAISTANPFVKPETSKSMTFGLVLEPVKNTSLSVDFWWIERNNEILGADPATVLGNPAGFPAAKITRNPDSTDGLPGKPGSGSLVSVEAPYTNGPTTKTNGIDIDLRQRFNLGEAGKLVGTLTWTHLNSFKRTLTDGSTYQYAGTDGPTSLSSSSGMPKDKATLALTWDRGPISLTGTVNYVSGTKNVEYEGDPNGCLLTFADGSDAPGAGCRAPSFTTFDLTGKYTVSKNLQVYGAITNLFDRVAPYDLSAFYGITHYNANYNQAGAMGRTISVGAKYQF
jgi:iron complex outermembrane receptor protein